MTPHQYEMPLNFLLKVFFWIPSMCQSLHTSLTHLFKPHTDITASSDSPLWSGDNAVTLSTQINEAAIQSCTRTSTQQHTFSFYLYILNTVSKHPQGLSWKGIFRARLACSGKERVLISVIMLLTFYKRLSTHACITRTCLPIFIHANCKISHNQLKDQRCHLILFMKWHWYKQGQFFLLVLLTSVKWKH